MHPLFLLFKSGIGQPLGQIGSDCGAAMGGDHLEGGVVHIGTVIGLVGNGTEDHERDAIAVGGLGNGGALHFGTQALGGFDDLILQFLAGDKLVAAGNSAKPGFMASAAARAY